MTSSRADWRTYFEIDALNWSRLKVMDESALAYKHALTHPRKDTPALDLGRYVHTAVFQPELVAEDFAIWTGDRRAGKVWDAFAEENADKTILRAVDLPDFSDMIEAVRSHPWVADLLSDDATEAEAILTWTGDGRAQKARPDVMNQRRRLVADLKTTQSIDIRRFGHDIARFSYLGQLAHYSAGIEAARAWAPAEHVLIAVEKAAPYDIAIFQLDADAIAVGAEKRAELLATLAECEQTGRWPGRHPEPVTLDGSNLPPWIFGGGIPEFAFVEDGT